MHDRKPSTRWVSIILLMMGVGWLVVGCASTTQVASIQEKADRALGQSNQAMAAAKQANVNSAEAIAASKRAEMAADRAVDAAERAERAALRAEEAAEKARASAEKAEAIFMQKMKK